MRIENLHNYIVHLVATPPTTGLLPLGTEVTSTMNGRQNGIIIGYNASQCIFYNCERYPYVILWEDGYIEVYGINSFEVKPHEQSQTSTD